jgi:hypothetical protein
MSATDCVRLSQQQLAALAARLYYAARAGLIPCYHQLLLLYANRAAERHAHELPIKLPMCAADQQVLQALLLVQLLGMGLNQRIFNK